MATIVEFCIPIDEFALTDTFSAISDLHVSIKRFVTHDTDSTMPFVWVTTDDFETFEATLGEDSTVETFETLAEFDEQRFYQIHWIDRIDFVAHLLLEEKGTITHAQATDDHWELRTLFPDYKSLSRTHEFCEENGLSLTVELMYELNSHSGSEFGLTEQQYTTLLEAKRQGYYEIPRSVSMAELADSLDVSHQALSERLRRAYANLIDSTIASVESDAETVVPVTEPC